MSQNAFHRGLTVFTVVACFTIIVFAHSEAKTPAPPASVLENAPPEFRDQFIPRHPPPYPVAKNPGHYTAQDWARAIDSVWGPGMSWAEHKSIWETVWNTVDLNFACFSGLDSSIWQQVWDRYNPEILDTVSRGRLTAITEWASMSLRETHTYAFDNLVWSTQLDPGVPLLVVGFTGVVDHFGAGLTSLPDSSLLVYKAVNPHPLGLVPGDLVLGYDRRPWKETYPELMAAELPLTGGFWGASPKAFTESFLIPAGMNWHLFDTIDVVKYATGDTVHLPTSLLVGQDMTLWASEQLEVPGVVMPDYVSGQLTSWGVIAGTHIGYIYSYGWFTQADVNNCVNALDSLKSVYNVDGVILDFRTNYGGMNAYGMLDYLFDSSWQAAGSAIRCGTGHFQLCQSSSVNISGAINSHWRLPLAILTGPSALSAGDMTPMILSQHPMAKVFGKPSSGAFSGGLFASIGGGWICRASSRTFFLPGQFGDYLTRKEFPSVANFPWVDYDPVWLTRDGVAQGTDDVVEAAKEWIAIADQDHDGVILRNDNCPMVGNPNQDPVAPVGDVNASGDITSADIIYMVNHVFKSGAAPLQCEAYGDVDCSGSLTSADIIRLVAFVFKSGASPCDVCSMATAVWSCP